MIPDNVREAIAAAQGSLYGIPGDPDRPSFSEATDTIREWAQDIQDDPTEEQDDDGNWVPIYYDDDEPWRSREKKLKEIVGGELVRYVL